MGGWTPYGYCVENRKLLVDEERAEHVRWIFARFLEIGLCTVLAREVATCGIRTPRGNRIEKKYLYRMLNNRAYIGEAVHEGESYPGEHDAIVDRKAWDRVPAGEIEAAVIDQLRTVFRQPEIVTGTWKAARAQDSDVTEDEAREALQQPDTTAWRHFSAAQDEQHAGQGACPRVPLEADARVGGVHHHRRTG